MTSAPDHGSRDVLVSEFIPLAQEAFAKTGYREVWGVDFPTDPAEWTGKHRGVLYKFVSAKPTVGEAVTQLTNTLAWRKEFRPLDAAYKEEHDAMFAPLGVITPTPDGRLVSWNLYGAIKDPAGTVFSDLEAFIRWRVGLMERGLAQLDFADPERDTMDQVHDYLNVSFLRMNPEARKGSQKIVQLFQDYYPELLRAKYFVNVPFVMMWVFKVVRMTMDSKTASKFHVVHNGADLASALGNWVPKAYGGQGKDLNEQAVQDTPTPKVIATPATEAPATEDAKPQSELANETPAKPVTETAAEPAKDSPAEPAKESPAEPATEPTVKRATEAAAEPAAEPPADPATEPTVKPAAEPTTEAVKDPAAEAVKEPTTEAVKEPPAEPVKEFPTEAVKEPPTEAATEPAAEPANAPPTESGSGSAEPSTGPVESVKEAAEPAAAVPTAQATA